jgi:hypothetical protein
MKLPIFIALASILLAGCAHQSRSPHANASRWPFPIHGQLADSDVAQIIAVVRRVPQIEHQIVWIDAQNVNRIRVYTGRIFGPLAGGGNVVTLQKPMNKWTVIGNPSVSVWRA